MQCVDRHSGAGLSMLTERDDLALRIERRASLARRSSLRIGGNVQLWAEVGSTEALGAVLQTAADDGLSVYVVGLGSNVLFPDEGLDGIAIRLVGDLADWEIASEEEDRARVRVGGGTVNAHLVRGLLEAEWVGAEFLRLIPGTFGGAVALNAGTKEAELSSILTDVDLVVPTGDGEIEERRVPGDELGLDYRSSELPEGAVVVGGRIEVKRGDVESARERMEADRERRDRTQPYKLASVGSTFANPEGDYAGRLIDEAGLKGERIGGARISETHANFFINEDDATAEDFLRLMALARCEVRRQFGVELRPEVRFVGFDGMQRIEAFEKDLC